MAEDPGQPVEVSIWIAAPPEAVFPFLTAPEKLVQWIGLVAELEPHPGGLFRVDMNHRTVVRGRYLEVRPPERVVFTWGHEDGTVLPAGSSTVEIVLIPDRGGTRVELRHSGLPGSEQEAHRFGWGHYIARLKTRMEGGDPGPDRYAAPDAVHGSHRS
ncbi:MAG: SRPBCC family protein [Myxococcaceae bacterium]